MRGQSFEVFRRRSAPCVGTFREFLVETQASRSGVGGSFQLLARGAGLGPPHTCGVATKRGSFIHKGCTRNRSGNGGTPD